MDDEKYTFGHGVRILLLVQVALREFGEISLVRDTQVLQKGMIKSLMEEEESTTVVAEALAQQVNHLRLWEGLIGS